MSLLNVTTLSLIGFQAVIGKQSTDQICMTWTKCIPVSDLSSIPNVKLTTKKVSQTTKPRPAETL